MHSSSPESHMRYIRQIVLPELGEAGQQALHDAKVAIIGLGGLGSPVALYLAAAGVGRLVLVDDDMVDLSNLQRQVIHGEPALGEPKVESAVNHIKHLNGSCITTAYQCRLSEKNADDITSGCQIIIDATDNFASRFITSDIAVKLKIPLVYGAIRRFEGQVCLFEAHKGTACYKCMHAPESLASEHDQASEEGVLGPVPGVIGSLQALEAIKYLAGLSSPLSGVLLSVDLLNMNFRKIQLKPNPDCSCQKDHSTII